MYVYILNSFARVQKEHSLNGLMQCLSNIYFALINMFVVFCCFVLLVTLLLLAESVLSVHRISCFTVDSIYYSSFVCLSNNAITPTSSNQPSFPMCTVSLCG